MTWRAFVGGIIAPELYARLDDATTSSGAADIVNKIVTPAGGVRRRTGTTFCGDTVDNTIGFSAFRKHVAIPMVISDTEAYVLAATNEVSLAAPLKFRIFTLGGYIVDPFNPPNPLEVTVTGASVNNIRWSQRGRELTLVCPGLGVFRVTCVTPTVWTTAPVTFGPTLSAPTGLTASVVTVGGPGPLLISYEYAVSAIASDGSESALSATDTASVDFSTTTIADYVSLSWTPVSGATSYNVYRRVSGGAWGFMGSAASASFVDTRSLVPDWGRAPPIPGAPLTGLDAPVAVAEHEQRRWFGGSWNEPLVVRASRLGARLDFSFSVPSRDTDAISFTLASRDGGKINHLLAMSELIAFTATGVWRIDAFDNAAITPSSVSARLLEFVGSTDVRPVALNNSVFYSTSGRSAIRALTSTSNGYVSEDLTERVRHLFNNGRVQCIAVQRNPFPVIWVLVGDNELLAASYLQEERVLAWSRHRLTGSLKIMGMAAIPDGGEDALYLLVRYREWTSIDADDVEVWRMSFLNDDDETLPYMDGAELIQPSGPITALSGLTRFAGKLIQVRQGLHVHRPITLNSSGDGALDYPIDPADGPIFVGLPYVSRLVTMPQFVDGGGLGFGSKKTIARVWLRMIDSVGGRVGLVGPGGEVRNTLDRSNNDFAEGGRFRIDFTPIRTTGQEEFPIRGDVEVLIRGNWTDFGQVAVEQRDPLPMHILAVAAESTSGGS